MRDLGQGDDARRYFELDLGIAERLAQAEPGRADYQRDLLVSLYRMMSADASRAASYRERGLGILRGLRSRGAVVPDLAALERAFGLE